MRRRTFVAAVVAAAACTGEHRVPPALLPHRGIGFDGFGARPTRRDFAALAELGASHVALFAYAYMPDHGAPVIRPITERHQDWSISDEGLRTMVRWAREVGLEVLVLPTLADFVDGHWRGEVAMVDEASWDQWFGAYQVFLLRYAELAESAGAAGLSIGTELRGTVEREHTWRQLAALVRDRFGGWLTYAANWDDFDTVPWWDAVDMAGIQAYFELGEPGSDRRLERLAAAWHPIRQRLEAFSARIGRRVLFTEIGYKSHTGATVHPWQWDADGAVDTELQRAAYEAAFRAFWREPWFGGFYWWKWRPLDRRDTDTARDFTPQGKPAEAVLRRYYLWEQ